METIRRHGQPTVRAAQLASGQPFDPAGTGAFAPGGVLSTLSDFFATSQGPDVAFVGGYQPPLAEETLTIQEFLNSLLPTGLTAPQPTVISEAVPVFPSPQEELARFRQVGKVPVFRSEEKGKLSLAQSVLGQQIDETNPDAIAGKMAALTSVLDVLGETGEDPQGMADVSREIGRLQSIGSGIERERTQQAEMLSMMIPLLMQQSQFGQTQQLAEQRLAGQQEETRRFEADRQAELERDLKERKQAASLIPQLFPNMEINEEILAGGIDPSLIPVLITLARLRAEQDAVKQRVGTLPTVTFAR